MSKKYKVQFNKIRQYEKKPNSTYIHKKVSTTLPIDFLKEIGVDENNPEIIVELDEGNNQLTIKKA